MTDLQTLHDAFTELERRADAAVPAALPKPRRASRFRLVPIVATMAAVAALAAGAVWVGDAPGTGSAVAASFPSTPDELAAKLKTLLGDTATFEVTTSSVDEDKPGVTIQGTLTADGVTGGFGLRVYAGPREPQRCDPAGCFVSLEWAVGNTTAVTEMPSTTPYAIVYGGYRALPDGMNVVMRVSNEFSSGGSNVTPTPHPPLEIDQLASILNAW